MSILMVSGSRHWTDVDFVRVILDKMQNDGYTTLLHGGALGLDSIAANLWEGESIKFEANWKELGKAAGPWRNQRMVDHGPDMFLGFPLYKSVGTYDAIRRVRKAGIPGAVYNSVKDEWVSLT